MIIGRKSDSDVQICTDATISRKHAVIEYVEKGNININSKINNIQFQVGGDVITIKYHDNNNQPISSSYTH